jgi:hypothetical protein
MALTKLSSSEFQTGAITTDKFSGDVALSVRIANVSIANSTYTVLDDTAVNVGGGYIVVTGAGFQSGAQIVINETPATSTTFVSSTELRAQIGAKSAATYDVYVVNPDGGSAIRVNGITYSASPTWVTGSTLDAQNADVAFNVSFSATGATSYANTTALPAGTTLLSNGYFYGTVTGIESQTTYNFTIRATDNENQDSDREFSLTVDVIILPTSVEYIVVAGGGAGGSVEYRRDGRGGGGGAGGLLTGNISIDASNTSMTMIVGSGGTYNAGVRGSNGVNSSITTSAISLTSIGGGGGGGSDLGGYAGGSGGGGGASPDGYNYPGGLGTSGQGYSGGTGGTDSATYRNGGGGGGASEPGQNAYAGHASGGDGQEWPIGSGNYYAGGGSGGWYAPGITPSLGGGGLIQSNDQGGNANTNSGGGGSGCGSAYNPPSKYGGNGGSGIIIVRYSDIYANATTTTGSPTYSESGGYKTYTFTGSGSITW